MARKKTIGFGFDPEEAQQHFLVIANTPKKGEAEKQSVQVYERFVWDKQDVQTSEIYPNGDYKKKIILAYEKWEAVKGALTMELNRILKADNKKAGRFLNGQTPVERLLGKEMMVLLWAIEDADPALIPVAIKNWLGFTREERWWLFTMTNALTGEADSKRGWRIALRYAITENYRQEERSQQELFSSLLQNF